MKMFGGRLNRVDYLIGLLIVFVVYFLVAFTIMYDYVDEVEYLLESPQFLVLYVVTLLFITALGVRRFHDIGLSGWWILLQFVPIINFGLPFYLLFKRGSDAPNEYGPPESYRTKILKILVG